LHGRLLDERLLLAMQVSCLGRRGCGHGPEQRRGCDKLLACARWCVRVVDVEICVDAFAGLLDQPRTRSPRAEASPAIKARSSRTARYSSAILASSSRA
jgi:hypothetical protein